MSREKRTDAEAARRVAEAARAEMRAAREAGPDGRALRIALARAEAEGATPVARMRRPSHGTSWTLAAGATAVLAAAGVAGLVLMPRPEPTLEVPAVVAAATPTPSPLFSAPPVAVPSSAAPLPESAPVHAPERAGSRRVGGTVIAPGGVVVRAAPAPPAPQRRTFEAPRPATAPAPPPLGDDLEAINGGALDAFARRWTRLPGTDAARLEADLLASVRGGDDFVEVPLPQLAGRGAAGAADAVRAYKEEREVVDPRLQRKVTLAFKGSSFEELCDELARQTGISIAAGKRVADDNVTVFCKDRPARDLMRAVARLFGFTWDRKGAEGEWTYRLNQPLRAQLLEEELRDRDRHEALVALDQEMRRYEDLLHLSPAEARAAAKNADGPTKSLLESLGGEGWAPARLYGTLTPEQLSALHNGPGGRGIAFLGPNSAGPPGAPRRPRRPDAPEPVGSLDPAWSRSVMDSFPSWKVSVGPNGSIVMGTTGEGQPGRPPVEVPGLEVSEVTLRISENELGVLTLTGGSGFHKPGGGSASRMVQLATGVSPSVRDPKNAESNAALKEAPGMSERVTLTPEPATNPAERADILTTAEALEAVHQATGRDVIGDHFTRVHAIKTAQVKEVPLFDALCRIGDALRLRWGSEDRWLTFRSTGFFHDRLKEVPKRHLLRWQAERERSGKGLPAPSALEIVALTDAQLDAAHVAEGARVLYGIEEWSTVVAPNLRFHWRLLSSLPRTQQDAALTSAEGVAFAQMPPEAQERVAARLAPFGAPQNAATGAASYADLLFRAQYTPVREPGQSAATEFTYRYRDALPGHFVMTASRNGDATYSRNRNGNGGAGKQ